MYINYKKSEVKTLLFVVLKDKNLIYKNSTKNNNLRILTQNYLKPFQKSDPKNPVIELKPKVQT